ncbi:MAG: hypothetical protein Q4G60_01200 [bacterium]|nr:hypothetical protein [bacterium]
MEKNKVPTVAELKVYIEEKEAYYQDCIRNKETLVISGPKFPGETVWSANSTLPLMKAAEEVGTPKEEVWKLCSKIASTTHAPVTKKEYERMIPFAKEPPTVDAVLKFLETYIPVFENGHVS